MIPLTSILCYWLLRVSSRVLGNVSSAHSISCCEFVFEYWASQEIGKHEIKNCCKSLKQKRQLEAMRKQQQTQQRKLINEPCLDKNEFCRVFLPCSGMWKDLDELFFAYLRNYFTLTMDWILISDYFRGWQNFLEFCWFMIRK